MARRDISHPKGHHRGRKISPQQTEMVLQAYAITGNKAEVARQMKMAWPTVHRIVTDAQKDASLQAVRQRTLEDVAGRVQGKTLEILDSIAPHDIESGLIKTYDDDGKLLAVKGYGPSLMQKVTSAAILTDKMKIIQETKQAMNEDRRNDINALPLPEDVATAIAAVKDRVARLTFLDVQFKDHHEELATKVQDIAHEALLHGEIDDAEYEELDLDNPGE